MPVVVDNGIASAKSRLALISLMSLTLRLMERWRHLIEAATGELPDYESTMVVGAVIVISCEKLIRGDLESKLESLDTPFPYDRLTRCNGTSIAAITGLNRETVRRKVNQLHGLGFLMRKENGSIHIAHGILQLPISIETVRAELEVMTRGTNELLAMNVLRSERRT